ncbi:MAG TPA: hypothetical protein VFB38_23965 [Chthonomonadaceae bacterium]|nr:hypothetical protein [Chthonomonadaceae bacterium]
MVGGNRQARQRGSRTAFHRRSGRRHHATRQAQYHRARSRRTRLPGAAGNQSWNAQTRARKFYTTNAGGGSSPLAYSPRTRLQGDLIANPQATPNRVQQSNRSQSAQGRRAHSQRRHGHRAQSRGASPGY